MQIYLGEISQVICTYFVTQSFELVRIDLID